ncbi:flagellar basal body L-ring protein FlgH [Oceanicella sp. SM1341]|uniref:flagellar basal body L-ring protein FlgH n=1 Tax=Oceanicella sp. SM1341 TaxID=1548889 RepID=UPI000E4A0254|nr:flagellar basal body L-ring protein FlgH [Oceanicella sp. SM1341]
MRRALVLLGLALAATGCSRLENVGKPPEMTPPGRPMPVMAPIAPERIALATPRLPPPPESYAAGSLWRNGPTSLFGDRRAQTLGDIVTVVIEIDESASISNETTRDRTGNENLSIAALLGLPSVADTILPGAGTLEPAASVASSSGSSGAGTVDREEEITLRIAATVTDMLPNGHMVIAGTQEIRVNYELRDLQVAGVIRPEDITRKNEITYDKIADARILYGGRGQITDVQQPRYGQQVADIILPF